MARPQTALRTTFLKRIATRPTTFNHYGSTLSGDRGIVSRHLAAMGTEPTAISRVTPPFEARPDRASRHSHIKPAYQEWYRQAVWRRDQAVSGQGGCRLEIDEAAICGQISKVAGAPSAATNALHLGHPVEAPRCEGLETPSPSMAHVSPLGGGARPAHRRVRLAQGGWRLGGYFAPRRNRPQPPNSVGISILTAPMNVM